MAGLQRRSTPYKDSGFISAQSNAVLAGWLAGCRWKEPCFHGATLLSLSSWLVSFLRATQRLQAARHLGTNERVYARVWNVLNAVKGLGKKKKKTWAESGSPRPSGPPKTN